MDNVNNMMLMIMVVVDNDSNGRNTKVWQIWDKDFVHSRKFCWCLSQGGEIAGNNGITSFSLPLLSLVPSLFIF